MDKGQSFVRRKRKEEMFTRLSNYMLRDERLSWKARGLLSYMLSMPDDWVFYETELVKHSEKDGITSLRSAMKELKEFGYVTKEPLRDEKGKVMKWVTYVEEEPIQNTENLECGFSTSSETHNVDNQTLLTTNSLLTTENKQTTDNNTYLSVDKSTDVKILIDFYKNLNNLPQPREITNTRSKSINARLKDYGLEELKNSLEYFNECNLVLRANEEKKNKKGGGWLTFDWIFNPNNMVKIVERKYEIGVNKNGWNERPTNDFGFSKKLEDRVGF